MEYQKRKMEENRIIHRVYLQYVHACEYLNLSFVKNFCNNLEESIYISFENHYLFRWSNNVHHTLRDGLQGCLTPTAAGPDLTVCSTSFELPSLTYPLLFQIQPFVALSASIKMDESETVLKVCGS